MCGSHTYVSENTTKHKCINIYGIFEREEFTTDFRQACESKI